MDNLYGVYATSRNAAWQCLTDYKIWELPIDLDIILKNSYIKLIENSKADMLPSNESGESLLYDNVWYIIYNDAETLQRSRFTIAHELGHIFLGHELIDGKHALQ